MDSGPVPDGLEPGASTTSTCEAEYECDPMGRTAVSTDARPQDRVDPGHQVPRSPASARRDGGAAAAPGNLGQFPPLYRKSPGAGWQERQPTESTRAFALSQCALWHMLRQVIQRAVPEGTGQSPGSVTTFRSRRAAEFVGRERAVEGRWPAIRRHVPDRAPSLQDPRGGSPTPRNGASSGWARRTCRGSTGHGGSPAGGAGRSPASVRLSATTASWPSRPNSSWESRDRHARDG